MDLISLRQGQELNVGFHILSDLPPSKCWKGELGLVRDFMGTYICMYGTEAQLVGHTSVPYLPGLFRCLECPRTCCAAPDCLGGLITLQLSIKYHGNLDICGDF